MKKEEDIRFQEAWIDKDILEKMSKREKALEDKVKLLEKENKELRDELGYWKRSTFYKK